MSFEWTTKEIETIEALKAEGLSYAEIAPRLGRTRNAVAGAVRRHIHKIPDTRQRHKPRIRTGANKGLTGTWTERALTETWAERKARRGL